MWTRIKRSKRQNECECTFRSTNDEDRNEAPLATVNGWAGRPFYVLFIDCVRVCVFAFIAFRVMLQLQTSKDHGYYAQNWKRKFTNGKKANGNFALKKHSIAEVIHFFLLFSASFSSSQFTFSTRITWIQKWNAIASGEERENGKKRKRIRRRRGRMIAFLLRGNVCDWNA